MKKEITRNMNSSLGKELKRTSNGKMIVNSAEYVQHNNNSKKSLGACQIPGCGCPEYKDNNGTCWNLNSSGGTCNHLASDHKDSKAS